MRNVLIFCAGIFVGSLICGLTDGVANHPELGWLPFGALIGICTGVALLARRR